MEVSRVKRVCFVAASETTVKAFLKEHIAALGEQYDVSVAVNTGSPDALHAAGVEARILPLHIARPIAPLQDLKALWQLFRMFRREQFDIVHSVTPKAGLLAMLAGFFARVPVRVHIFTGQVWATRRGFSRWLLKSMDRLLAAAATHLLADSLSQRQFLIDQRVAEAGRITVLGKGSISGVDVHRFAPDAEARARIRAEIAVGDNDVLFLFLGRLNRDKGVLDLAQAFAVVAGEHPHVHLLIVGPDEEGLVTQVQAICQDHLDQLHFVPYTSTPQQYMAAADVFCLPSYREGFGSVIIEAAAAGLPAIGSDIYGISDAIDRDHTGLLFPAGDVSSLAKAMRRLLEDPGIRQELAANARKRVLADFDSSQMVRAWLDYYRLLG